MTNDNSRHWAVLAPIDSGPTLTAQAQQVEAAGLAGISSPQLYSSPFMTLGHCAAVTERVQLATGVAIADTRSPFETVEIIRLIVAGADNGKLERFEGAYHRHDWSQFQGAFAPSVRPRIPISIAAAQSRLTRLVGEIADGFISHPIHSTRWTREHALPALQEGLRNAGRARDDVHWNAWYYEAVNPGEALQDARATVAFYAQFEQYERMFAAQGFEKEARACQAAARRKEYATAGAAAVTDDMAETFVILGTPDECRARLDEVWDVADSFSLVPPAYALPPDKSMAYAAAIADTFYE